MKIYIFLILFFPFLTTAQIAPIPLHWLDSVPPSVPVGVSWGVPFARGAVRPDQSFALREKDGASMPLQTWINAYWDDGSVKWLGLATVSQGTEKALELQAQKSAIKQETAAIKITVSAESFRIDMGRIRCKIPRSGSILLDSLQVFAAETGDVGRLVGTGGHLQCLWQNAPDEAVDETQSIEKKIFKSHIETVDLEQKGATKVVVRIAGRFSDGQRSWFPFLVRFYFYEGVEQIKIVQTLMYDGDAERDFVKGVGWQFEVPMREQVLNRHVRLGGAVESGGIWAEPVQPATGRRVLQYNDQKIYDRQFLGKRIPNADAYHAKGQALLRDWAAWNDYRLIQHHADGFSIQKRTHVKGAWLDANAGQRAQGIAFLGDVSGGLSLGIRQFWQSHPAAFEIKNAAATPAAGVQPLLRGWLWSPFGEAMDMRHYDTLAYGHGLEASYEDVQPGFATPTGIARTSELYLFLHDSVPSNGLLARMAQAVEHPALLAATPQYLHDAGAFGVWSLPNRNTKKRQWIENQLDTALVVYLNEVEQRRWYGYWNYGDVMHGYDSTRHSWRYDIGGYAWANSELVPDLWLWYSFLRSGRADVFRMAEAMTRHTSEVDVYHLGRFAGLGSRHNVRHWGDGAKEIRISQCALKRFYYYLTTDERTGELMRAVALADTALLTTNPLRQILPKSTYPTYARIGPDWLAMVSNWMTEWERTGNPIWKEKIQRGVRCFAGMPYGFFSGKEGAFGYDPGTNKLFQLAPDDIGQSHLSVLMGGPEMAFELSRYFNDADWQRLWLQYCQLYGSSPAETEKIFGKSVQLGTLSPHFCRLPAYWAFKNKDRAMAEKAWAIFFADPNVQKNAVFPTRKINAPTVLRPVWEVPNISTNNTAQWSLNAIEMLELIGEYLEDN